MDDVYAIRLAKTELREAYNAGDVDRVLAIFADGYSDMSVGQPSSTGPKQRLSLGTV
jgi:ketosteroid isomerase-like protein